MCGDCGSDCKVVKACKFFAVLSAPQVVPFKCHGAQIQGCAKLSLDSCKGKLKYKIKVSNISSCVISAGFYIGKPCENGCLIRRICFRGCKAKGCIDRCSRPPLTKGFIESLRACDIYIQINTKCNPCGEARGQVVPCKPKCKPVCKPKCKPKCRPRCDDNCHCKKSEHHSEKDCHSERSERYSEKDCHSERSEHHSEKSDCHSKKLKCHSEKDSRGTTFEVRPLVVNYGHDFLDDEVEADSHHSGEYDGEGYDKDGYDREGYDKDGYDREGNYIK